jgi:hypothetical protein
LEEQKNPGWLCWVFCVLALMSTAGCSQQSSDEHRDLALDRKGTLGDGWATREFAGDLQNTDRASTDSKSAKNDARKSDAPSVLLDSRKLDSMKPDSKKPDSMKPDSSACTNASAWSCDSYKKQYASTCYPGDLCQISCGGQTISLKVASYSGSILVTCTKSGFSNYVSTKCDTTNCTACYTIVSLLPQCVP